MINQVYCKNNKQIPNRRDTILLNLGGSVKTLFTLSISQTLTAIINIIAEILKYVIHFFPYITKKDGDLVINILFHMHFVACDSCPHVPRQNFYGFNSIATF